MKLSAATILVHGRVQGVGYRAFVLRRARELGLTGYAVNLPGGDVKVRAEGRTEALDRLLHDLETGPPLARVETVSVTPAAYSGRFPEFTVRFSEGS